MFGPTLLTGATGFIGRHLYPALAAAGYDVRCGSRRPHQAAEEFSDRTFVHFDADDTGSARQALRGCESALYLVHGMGQGADYPELEERSASAFLAAAEAEGVKRIVYLGGVVPEGKTSRHLRSRQRTGEILRSSAVVSTIELRAAMVVGTGSTSWTMVRDLAARLPAMLLPRWLNNSSYPVFVDDVVLALLSALALETSESRIYEIPGPERVTHREVLERTAMAQGHHRYMISVPVLSPRLSSYWISLVTRVDLDMAKELVEGVKLDLHPTEPLLWPVIGHTPLALDKAIELAVNDGDSEVSPSPDERERLIELGQHFRQRELTDA